MVFLVHLFKGMCESLDAPHPKALEVPLVLGKGQLARGEQAFLVCPASGVPGGRLELGHDAGRDLGELPVPDNDRLLWWGSLRADSRKAIIRTASRRCDDGEGGFGVISFIFRIWMCFAATSC